MSEKWLPKLQETFNVMPIHQCINDPQPYWEEAWVYPTLDVPEPPRYAREFENENTVDQSVAVTTNRAMNTLFSLALVGFVVTITTWI